MINTKLKPISTTKMQDENNYPRSSRRGAIIGRGGVKIFPAGHPRLHHGGDFKKPVEREMKAGTGFVCKSY
jgi:hypothetical protein